MEVFAWNPKAGNETLDAFNDRLHAYCVENPVIAVDVSTFAEAIVVSLTMAEDAGLEVAAALIPHVILLAPTHRLQLEQVLGNRIQWLAEQDSDDNPCVPFKVTTHATDAAGNGYAVILINGGEIELDSGAPEAGGDDGQSR